MQRKEKTIHQDIPMRPWDVIGAYMFQLNNKNCLCIVDYHSRFPVKKEWKGCQQSLIAAIKIKFEEYGIPQD